MSARNILDFLVITTSLLMVMTFTAIAQEHGRSGIIEQYKGKSYYMHFVKQGETYYSLSKLYNVTPETIRAENPEAGDALKVDQLLRIPFSIPDSESEIHPKEKATEVPVNEKEVDRTFLYTVGKQETLYGIARKFGITVEDIMKVNPGMETLNSGSRIRIPDLKNKEVDKGKNFEPAVMPKPENTITVEVEQGETIYSLTRKYHVSEDRLRQLNPSLAEGLKAGQMLVIPATEPLNTPAVAVPETPKQGKVLSSEEIIPALKDSIKCFSHSYSGEVFNIAILLPFATEEVDSVEACEADNSKNSSNIKGLEFYPFYAGMLLAFDSLGKTGFRANIRIMDADKERDTLKIRKAIRKLDFEDTDLIIGPVYQGSSAILSRMARGTGVNVVNPLTRRLKVVEGNPHVYKVQPQDASYVRKLEDFLISSYPGSNLLIVKNETGELARLCDAFSKSVSDNPQFRVINIDYQKQTFSDVVRNLSTDRRNMVLVFSANKSLVPNLVSLLNQRTSSFQITLVGMPGWENLDLDTEFLVNLNYHQLSTQFVDYDNPDVQEFVKKYRDRFNAEPTVDKLAFLGYDIAWYFSNALMQFGKELRDCVPYLSIKGLQNDFVFRSSSPSDGNINQSVKIIRLVDYKWKEVR